MTCDLDACCVALCLWCMRCFRPSARSHLRSTSWSARTPRNRLSGNAPRERWAAGESSIVRTRRCSPAAPLEPDPTLSVAWIMSQIASTACPEAIEAAKAAGLRYSNLESPGITRKRSSKGFCYL